MKPELATRLRHVLKGEANLKAGVTGVAGVTARLGYASNPAKLRQLRLLRLKSTEERSGAEETTAEGVTEPLARQCDVARAVSADDFETEIAERAAIAAELGNVPQIYCDAFARLQCRRPLSVSPDQWLCATADAGLFFDQWGSVANLHWTRGDIFDAPADGKSGGLIWFLQGETVRALGPEHAITQSGRVFDRLAGACHD